MKKLIGFLFFMATVFSCQRDETLVTPENEVMKTEKPGINAGEGQMILGKQLENPYSVENMQLAYTNLVAENKLKGGIKIETTHYYVRFLPKDFKELDKLEMDTKLILFDYPLDRKIEQGGTSYHDPDVPKDKVTWQYTVVPVDFKFPEVKYKILANLFLNDEPDQKLKSATIDPFDYEEIEVNSLKMTNNYNPETYSSSLLKSSWNPTGFIRVWDDVLLRKIPVEGAKVRVKNWFKIREKYTDSDGYFITGSFDNAVDYSIKWEMDHYDIRNGTYGQAYYQGPNESRSAWNLDIYGGESIMYATIQRAAFKSFYGDNLGISRPIIFSMKTKICYKDGFGSGVYWGDWSAGGIFPDIKIWGRDAYNNYHNTNIVFGTTVHELGHQSHTLKLGNLTYWGVDKVIYESWAEAVEWALTNGKYLRLGNIYNNISAITYNHLNGNQGWKRSWSDWEYSPAFIDLIDSLNQRVNGNSCPNDRISGYSMSFINNNILPNTGGIYTLKENIKSNKIIGVTDADIDDLYLLYL